MSLENQGYIPERKPGDIVSLNALLDPKTFSPAFQATAEPAKELKGFRLKWCKAGMGEEPYEYWVVEAVGGPCEGEDWGAYVFKPGHETK